jgi:hypothetical protein
MREPDLRGLLDAAQSRIGGARALLAHPRACDPEQCITLFREAQGYLEWVRDSLAQAGPVGRDLRGQATALAAEICQTGILVEQAARFGRRWLQGLRSMSPEYTAYGHCVPLAIRGHISVRG